MVANQITSLIINVVDFPMQGRAMYLHQLVEPLDLQKDTIQPSKDEN